jgi:RNA binding exosome subunit
MKGLLNEFKKFENGMICSSRTVRDTTVLFYHRIDKQRIRSQKVEVVAEGSHQRGGNQWGW